MSDTLWYRRDDEEMTEEELMDQFDEVVDENYPTYELFGVTYSASSILRDNPVDYREAFLNWSDAEGWDSD